MTQHSVSQEPQEERASACAPKLVGDKEFSITGLKITRGKPSPMTNKDSIGEDGKIEYVIVETNVDLDGEGSTSFFGTSAIKSQIQRFDNYTEAFAKGDSFGPVKLGKKQSLKSNSKYWCLIFPNEEDY